LQALICSKIYSFLWPKGPNWLIGLAR
jgi:hypothetical protein